MKTIKVSLEGNIGSGKSTLQKIIDENKEYLGIDLCVPEDISGWMNNGIFDAYLNDSKKYATTFQLFVLMTRAVNIEKNLNKNFIMERSCIFDYECFVKANYEVGNINETEMKVIKESYDIIMTKLFKNMTDIKVIYLKTPHEECIRRIKQRDRSIEKDKYFTDYIKILDKNHDKAAESYDQKRILRLDGTLDYINNMKIREEMLKKIKIFIQ